jgi:hypothetical protein
MLTAHVCLLIQAACCASLQAVAALDHPYFDDLDKASVDKLENPALVYSSD